MLEPTGTAVKRLARGIALEVIPNFFISTLLYIAVFLVQRVLAQQYLSALPAALFVPWLIYQTPAFALLAFPIAAVFAVLLAAASLAVPSFTLSRSFSGEAAMLVHPGQVVDFTGFLPKVLPDLGLVTLFTWLSAVMLLVVAGLAWTRSRWLWVSGLVVVGLWIQSPFSIWKP